METLTLLRNRRSLRVYGKRPVSPQLKQTVLEAALSAPTAGALMLYAMIEVSDENLKQTLAHTCDEQPFIAQAPWVVLFAADYQRLYDSWQQNGQTPLRKPGVGDLMLAISDALIAAQTAVIAAEAMGLGSCYIGDIIENAEEHQRLLGLPPYVFPAALLCFGYPPEGHQPRPIPRLPLRHMLHQNGYQPKEWLDSEWAQRICNRGLEKFEANFSAEMTRSVQVWLQNWQ